MVGVGIAVDLFLVGSGRPMNCSSLKENPVVTRQSFEGSAALLSEVRRDVDQNDPPWRIDTVDASINWATCGRQLRACRMQMESALWRWSILSSSA